MANSLMTMSVKVGNTLPAVASVLYDEDGTLADLTEVGTTVKFVMGREPGRQAKVDADAQITDAAAAEVQYNWTDADTDTPGVYSAEFEVHYPSGKIKSFPDGQYIIITILARAGVEA